MENTFLANLQREGQIKESDLGNPAESETSEKATSTASPADDKPKEDATASPAENEKKDDSQSEKGEKKEPVAFHAFHEHPRWIATQNELEDLRAFKERALPLLESLEKSKETEKTSDKEIPEWFNTLFGNNPEVWKLYEQYSARERKSIRDEIMGSLAKEEELRLANQQKSEKWVDSELRKLTDSKGIDFVSGTKEKPNPNQQELLQVILDYRPTDDDGNISFEGAYKIFQRIKQAPQQKPNQAVIEKKQIADKTIKKSGEGEEKKSYRTNLDLQKHTFADIAARAINS